MSDDELRRRLQEIPGPRAGIDADAVLAGARRRRRPKVAAVTAATAGAAVLIVAPFVVPGLSPIAPSSVVLTGDAGAPAPESATESGEDDAGAAAPLGCELLAADSVGLALRFLDDPADGAADLELVHGLGTFTTIELSGIGSADVAADGTVVATGVDAGQSVAFELAAGAAGTVAVDLPPRTPCGGSGAQPAGVAPVVTVRLPLPGGGTEERTVVGEPYAVR